MPFLYYIICDVHTLTMTWAWQKIISAGLTKTDEMLSGSGSVYVCVCPEAYLSSSPLPGLCSICSPAPSPAPWRKLCANSPPRVQVALTNHNKAQRFPSDPHLLTSRKAGWVTPIYLSLHYRGRFCFVFGFFFSPWTQLRRQCRTQFARAAESIRFPWAIPTDMCLLRSSLPPSRRTVNSSSCLLLSPSTSRVRVRARVSVRACV